MERTGIITFLGKGMTLVGDPISVGMRAPDFHVVDKGLNPVSLKTFAGKRKLISVTPSLDTSICDAQLRRFNETAVKAGDDVVMINMSVDLPFAIGRFCTTAGIERAVALSDYMDRSFGRAYGLLIKELQLLARAVVILDKEDMVRYVEIVPEVASHPDYDKALAALRW